MSLVARLRFHQKEQIKELQRDIYLLVEKKDTISGIQCRMKWVLVFDQEKILFAGSSNQTLKGIFKQTKP